MAIVMLSVYHDCYYSGHAHLYLVECVEGPPLIHEVDSDEDLVHGETGEGGVKIDSSIRHKQQLNHIHLS